MRHLHAWHDGLCRRIAGAIEVRKLLTLSRSHYQPVVRLVDQRNRIVDLIKRVGALRFDIIRWRRPSAHVVRGVDRADVILDDRAARTRGQDRAELTKVVADEKHAKADESRLLLDGKKAKEDLEALQEKLKAARLSFVSRAGSPPGERK